MNYLMIRNPGVADYRGLTLLGVSTTRGVNKPGTVGCFGSGSKLSLALLLRNGITPTIIPGNLKLDFSIKKEIVQGQIFNRICVKYSGKDLNRSNKSSTEDLGFTLEWGVQDWTKLSMAIREFVSNAIDGSICSGGTYKDVVFEIVEKPRAKSDHTSVFIPLTPEVESVYNSLGNLFLHFSSDPTLLNKQCLPKRKPGEDTIYVYKKGVLVCYIKGNSVYDYNLGNELTLDESRNATEWDVKYSVARHLKDSPASVLVPILKEITTKEGVWEAELPYHTIQQDSYCSEEVKAKRKKEFQEAWTKVAGMKGIVSSGNASIDSFVTAKGYSPVCVSSGWKNILESYEIASERSILTKNELDGRVISEPTPEMIECTRRVWELFKSYNLTKNKEIPKVKGFTSIMDGCQFMGGYWQGDCIYLNNIQGDGKRLFAVVLEECTHYITESLDGSRDLQSLLFNLVTEIAY